MQGDSARRQRPVGPVGSTPVEWAAGHWNVRAGSIALALLLLAITVWRAWVVVHVRAGLHVDEAQYWVWSQSLDWGYYSKPPVIAALIAASTALLGDGLLGVKAFAMLCYPLTAWVLFRWVSEVVGDLSPGSARVPERAGLVAALLFIASPVAGLLGLAATTDAPLLLAWSLASRSLWRAWRDGLPRDWAWLGVWLGLGLMSKYTMAAFVVSALGLLVTASRERVNGWSVPRGLGLTALVAIACIAPNLEWNAQHGWPTLRHTAEITIGVESVSRTAALAEYVIGLLMLLGPVVGPVVLASRWTKTAEALRALRSGTVGRHPQRRDAWLAAAWLSLPLALVGGVQAWHGRAQVNWAAPVLIGATLAVALALRAEWPGRRLRGWYVALALQTVLLAGITLATDVAGFAHKPLPRRLDVWARMRGWDQAFAQLQPAAEAFWREQALADPSRPPREVLATDRAVIANGAYAWRKIEPHWVAWRAQGEKPHDHFQLTAAVQPGDRPTSLLYVSDGPPQGPILAAFSSPPRRLAVAEVQQTPGRVLHLELWQVELAPQPPAQQASPLLAQVRPQQADRRTAKTRRAPAPAPSEKPPGQKG